MPGLSTWEMARVEVAVAKFCVEWETIITAGFAWDHAFLVDKVDHQNERTHGISFSSAWLGPRMQGLN